MTARQSYLNLLFSCTAALALAAATQAAHSADLAAPKAPAPVPGAFDFFTGIEYHVQGEAGILGNSLNPSQGINGEGYNFGSLYEDHANTPILNQILLTATKAVDPKATGYAFGFTLQGLYGSDMRSNHFLGIGTYFMGRERNQLNLTQAFIAGHLPLFTSGGVDVKVGAFTSPQGYETLDPSTSPFYSHSYTYFYNVTFNHTGILTTTHVNPKLDFYLGVDTGNQTTFGYPNGDPNGKPSGFVGFGLNNLLNDKLTVLALSHIGPENPYPRFDRFGNFNANDPTAGSDLRYYNDVVFTYKVNDNFTSVTELNYTRDDYGVGNGPASAYSVSQYFGYTFGKIYTLNFRGEAYRDSQNFFVSTPTDNSGIAKTEQGIASTLRSPTLFAPNGLQGTTYGELTLGLTIKPDVPKPLALVLLRPEIRYDRVLAGGPAYNNNGYLGGSNGSRGQFTFGGDVVIGF